jgi:drug/metabolite transporter (DMT)-like permease
VLSLLDLFLVLMVLIWGANFSVVKVAMRDFPELAFNALRLVIGSSIFGAAIWWTRRRGDTATPPITRADWRRLVVLGVVGHLVYQLMFLGGLKRTSVGNGSLIVGSSPVVIALFSSLAGHERVTLLRWVGVLLALLGLYLVVGHRVDWSLESRVGDALMFGSLLCWATYSVGAQPLLKRHSPLIVTGVSMSVGCFLYLVSALPVLVSLDWRSISALSWWLMIGSAVLALSVAYLIWYTAVQRLGSTRTSVYSYLTPVVAMVVAALWLDEPISRNQVLGAATILAGLLVTRIAPSDRPSDPLTATR